MLPKMAGYTQSYAPLATCKRTGKHIKSNDLCARQLVILLARHACPSDMPSTTAVTDLDSREESLLVSDCETHRKRGGAYRGSFDLRFYY